MEGIDTLKKMIAQALKNCTDIDLLDFILKLIAYDKQSTVQPNT